MRNDFAKQVLVEMDRDQSIYFLTADLGYNALEAVEHAFPKRFINVGISEQHMIGMATGLALEGKKVIAYSIASFATMRPYEMIRDDVCYHNLDVKIIGVGGGYNYATHGVTHHTIEDLAIMRVLPHMKVLAPGYSWEAREATKALMRDKGPAYIRLGKSPGTLYEKKDFKFKIGKGYVIKEGTDIVLISTGNVLDLAMSTSSLLEKQGLHVGVISMPTIKPLDTGLITRLAKKANAVFTIEEHSAVGGLGSAVKEALWDASIPVRFHAFGLPADIFNKAVGDRDHLLKKVGIDGPQIAKKIMRTIKK